MEALPPPMQAEQGEPDVEMVDAASHGGGDAETWAAQTDEAEGKEEETQQKTKEEKKNAKEEEKKQATEPKLKDKGWETQKSRK